ADLLGRMALDSAQDVRDACLEALLKALSLEQDGAGEPEVIATIAYALGHLNDERAVAHLLPLADHESEDVRLGVACALPQAARWQIYHRHPEAVAVLMRLSADAD